ncbi:hypothetical protein BGZ61DRAFT_231164 [Ilyonectria robusta]|uniref:uncharacterized protein n=1 Tax=Ilyonectria robusta TaxID=1079257 RepID=UPI001E8D8E1D|nr:uncharacterized protein BGZ61DRAFT_231164 [Ilyonectria robusta]KAH8651671.1 hypothetical protein BGZ61DRAFT_231164 [Ilyonectria robusta]
MSCSNSCVLKKLDLLEKLDLGKGKILMDITALQALLHSSHSCILTHTSTNHYPNRTRCLVSSLPFRLTVQTDEVYPNYRYIYSFQFNLEELIETNPALITKLQVAIRKSGMKNITEIRTNRPDNMYLVRLLIFGCHTIRELAGTDLALQRWVAKELRHLKILLENCRMDRIPLVGREFLEKLRGDYTAWTMQLMNEVVLVNSQLKN